MNYRREQCISKHFKSEIIVSLTGNYSRGDSGIGQYNIEVYEKRGGRRFLL